MRLFIRQISLFWKQFDAECPRNPPPASNSQIPPKPLTINRILAIASQ